MLQMNMLACSKRSGFQTNSMTLTIFTGACVSALLEIATPWKGRIPQQCFRAH